jgi:dTDP-4-amino-4,6-dideoxygalactose transaminase
MTTTPVGGWYYEQIALGYNYRMTELQAALALSQLSRLNEFHAKRERLADRYDSLLSALPVRLPQRQINSRSAWHLYVIEIDTDIVRSSRKEIYDRLRSAGIGVNVHYIPIHTQPYFQRMGCNWGDCPESERYYQRALSLPLFPEMTEAQQDFIVNELAGSLT